MKNINHPNILTIHGAAVWSKGFGVIVDAIDGGSVYNFLQQQRPIPWELKLQISYELASALTYLHYFDDCDGIAHGNFDTKNLHLTSDLKLQLPYFDNLDIIMNGANQQPGHDQGNLSKANDVYA